MRHHHADHVGVGDALRSRRRDAFQGPAHTGRHIAYSGRAGAAAPIVFGGDTMVSAGVGKALRASGKPTFGRQAHIEALLRCGEPAVIAAAHVRGTTPNSGSNGLAAVRTWKNEFR